VPHDIYVEADAPRMERNETMRRGFEISIQSYIAQLKIAVGLDVGCMYMSPARLVHLNLLSISI
jgi:hypothetical protein